MAMPERPTGGAAANLPFGETLGGAFAIVFERPWMFMKALILPALLWIVLGVVGFVLADVSLALLLVVQVLGVLPLSILGVAYCRLALLGRQAGAIPRPLFGRRTWVYFGYTLLFGIVTGLPILAIVLIGVGEQMQIGPGAVQDPAAAARRGLAMFPIFLLAYLVLMYLAIRFCLVFPAVAVDQKLGLRGSWRLTRGRAGLKLYAVLYVLYLICMNAILFLFFMGTSIFGYFVTRPGVLPDSPQEISVIGLLAYLVPTIIVMLALEALALGLVSAAVSHAYARLSNWSAQAEPEARFE